MNATRFLLYGCGQLGMMALARFFFQWIVRFGDNGGAVGLTAAAVSLLFFAFRIFDGVTDPIAGVVSDRWVSSGKQRRGLLWFSFLFPPLGLALVFAPGGALSAEMNWLLLGSGMFVFFLGYTFYAIPYWSLMDDYSRQDMSQRAKLSNVLGAGVLVATAVGFLVSPILVEHFGYLTAAICFGVPCSVLMVLPYYAQPEGARTAPAHHDDDSLLQGFKLVFRHRRFIAVIVLFAGGQMSFTVMTSAAPYIAVDLLGGKEGDVASLLGPFLGLAVPAFLLVPRFVGSMGWERTTLTATLALGVVYGGTGLLGASVLGTPLITAMVVFALGGPMAAVLLGLEGEAITSCASEQTREVTAVYFGVYNFIVKALNGAAVAITGILSSQQSTLGPLAVRMMGFTAGGLLFLGVMGYWALRPRAAAIASASS